MNDNKVIILTDIAIERSQAIQSDECAATDARLD